MESSSDTRRPAAAPAPRRAGLGPRLALLALGLVVAAALLEAAARVRLYLKYGRTSADVYETALDPATGLMLPPAGRDFGPAHINALGFRGPELPREKPPGTLRVAFLGGSTTFCAEAGPDEATWPHLLTGMLERAHPGLEVDYLNAGLQGFGVAESRKNLLRVAPLDPDVVVIYHATNDLTRDTRALADAQGLTTSQGDERSALARVSLAWDLVEKNVRSLRRRERAQSGVGLLELDASSLAAGFEQRLVELVREAQQVAPLVVLITFSTRLRREQGPEERKAAMSSSILYMPYMDAERLLDGFAAYNAAIRAAAARTGAVLVEVDAAVPGDAAHFQDSVHLTARGCARFAEVVAEQLLASEALQELAATRRDS